MKDRFTPQYAASAEVTAVLRQGTDIQRYMSTQPPDFDGASEWNRLSASLGQLAAVYGAPWPLTEGARGAADERWRAEEDSRRALQERRHLQEGAGFLSQEGQDDRFGDPRSGCARGGRLEEGRQEARVSRRRRPPGLRRGAGPPAARGRRAETAISGRAISPAAQSAWGDFQSGLDKVAQAFGMPKQVP